MSLDKEAAVIVTATLAFIGAVVTLLVTFGVDLSDEQQKAILATAGSFFALLLVSGPIIRQFVFSKNTTDRLVDAAYVADPAVSPPPVVS